MDAVDRERSAQELKIIERIRAIVAKLPEVESFIDGHSHTTFRVGKKSIVMIGGGHGSGSLSIKSDPTTQAMLIRQGPYIRTSYIGQHGWVTVWGDAKIDWAEIRELVTDAYRLAAPKRLLKQLDDS